MNPTLDPVVLERERLRDEEKYRREFDAEFTDAISRWIPSEILDPCINYGRRALPFSPGSRYAAALDPASRNNDFGLAILHAQGGGNIVVDRVERWAGTKSAPLAFEFVLSQVRDILSLYSINCAIGDQFYFDALQQHLLKLGITYKPHFFGANTRAKIFGDLKHLLVQQKIQLPNDPELLRQLRSLQEEKSARGRICVRATSDGRDGLAVVLALAASEAVTADDGSYGAASFADHS